MTTTTRDEINFDYTPLVQPNADTSLPQGTTPEEQAQLERKLAYKQTLLDRYARTTNA